QRNIVPDHLALLPEGTLGACSNADGCGINNNQLKNNALFRINCAECGGTCPEAAPTPVVLREAHGKKAKQTDPKVFANLAATKAFQDAESFAALRTVFANSFPAGMLAYDAESLVRDKLRAVQGYSYLIGLTPEK